MAEVMCRIFNCDMRHGNYCCRQCKQRKICKNPCRNHPSRCKSSIKKEAANGR